MQKLYLLYLLSPLLFTSSKMNLFQTYINRKCAEAIELCLLDDNYFIGKYCYLEFGNNKIKDVFFENVFHNNFTTKRKTSGNNPISVIINGKGILSKSLNVTNYSSESVQDIFPSANLNDFYIAEFKYSEKIQISLIRKDKIHQILEIFNNLQLTIQSVYIGINSIPSILDFINTESPKEIRTTFHTISINNENIITEIIAENNSNNIALSNEILIGEHYVKQDFLVAFSTAIMLVAASLDHLPNFPIDNLIKVQENIIRNTKIKKFLFWYISSLIILFTINLIVNYFISQSINALETYKIDNHLKNLEENILNKKTAKKRDILNELGWQNKNNIALYADIISSNRVPNILFTNLEIFNTDNKIKSNKAENYFAVIDGIALSALDVSEFIANLNKSNKFKKINLSKYIYETSDSLAQFRITINLSK